MKNHAHLTFKILRDVKNKNVTLSTPSSHFSLVASLVLSLSHLLPIIYLHLFVYVHNPCLSSHKHIRIQLLNMKSLTCRLFSHLMLYYVHFFQVICI